ncbi:phospholipase effector Tle1 domain-containing protein [Mycolicibacterium sp. XJ1819]
MKNLVLCFDRGATNAERLFSLLDDGGDQTTWSSSDRPGALRSRWPSTVAEEARGWIAGAYEFLLEQWAPGDRIYAFGAGLGGSCALALTRLLGTVGLLPDLKDYVLAAYALPRTQRSPQDWERVKQLAAELAGQPENSVPVRFLGLFDTLRVPGVARRAAPPVATGPTPDVTPGRHAVAIDGPLGGQSAASAGVEEVWFRGAHCDITGGPRACWPMADIALDWVLDGAVQAGLAISASRRHDAPAPSEFDALTGNVHTVSWRRPPVDAVLHASVEFYLRHHPEYWRRLPARVCWADPEWAARGERLLPAVAPRERVLTAAAS